MATATNVAFEQGLPAHPEAERLVLGSILLDDSSFLEVASILKAEDFSLEKHRRIFARMGDLYQRGERIDRISLANELMRQGQLESELGENSWLTVGADIAVIFDTPVAQRYDRALMLLGLQLWMLSPEAGHA